VVEAVGEGRPVREGLVHLFSWLLWMVFRLAADVGGPCVVGAAFLTFGARSMSGGLRGSAHAPILSLTFINEYIYS
jgi:hypothetical protein